MFVRVQVVLDSKHNHLFHGSVFLTARRLNKWYAFKRQAIVVFHMLCTHCKYYIGNEPLVPKTTLVGRADTKKSRLQLRSIQ